MGCPLKDMIQAVEGNFWPTFVNLGKFTGSSEHPCWRATLMATLLQGPQLPLLLAGNASQMKSGSNSACPDDCG